MKRTALPLDARRTPYGEERHTLRLAFIAIVATGLALLVITTACLV